MAEVTIKNNVKFPRMNFNADIRKIANRIIIPDIAGHIDSGIDIDGKAYDELAESTKKAKGHGKPLIGKERKLFSSAIYRTKREKHHVYSISIKSARKEIAKYLQVDGVKSKRYGKRRFNFFGVSQKAEKGAMQYMRNVIKRLTNAR